MEQRRADPSATRPPYTAARGGAAEAGGIPGTRGDGPVPAGGHHPAFASVPPSAPARGGPSVPAPASASGALPLPVQVRRHSVRGQILDALRSALAAGELAPGEVYSAPALGRRFGVSATPVREAMQRLAAEGSVEVVPNRGFRVAEREPAELAELAEVRALIEVPVLLRLARADPAPAWEELRPAAERCTAAAALGDRGTYVEHDRAFHRALLSLGGNRQLVLVAEDLHRRSQWPSTGSGAVRRADLIADAAEHTALLDALVARNLPGVAALVREHFTGADC
ncbi:GntR family transcriptional regulator [Streptomyces sp. NBC_01497]|uniref:GntR family transcriptional regulator n=1 Tax=Streptomyces sp. NBC_01497 TaxID=2903885 RepID=UPI002E34B952|nr:GntR family transcriptional regulator [Streptomyces sp. NBC_01497]